MWRKITLLSLVTVVTMICLVTMNYQKEHFFRIHQHLEKAELQEALPAWMPSTHQDAESFYTHLPLISIDTGGQNLVLTGKKSNTVMARIEIRDQAEAYNRLSDLPVVDTAATIRYRGHSSLYFDKHSYLLKFKKADGTANELQVLGMPAEEEWVLHGPFLDKSLIRNYMAMNISAEIMGYAPRVRFCELIENGDYRGVYVLMESISRAKGRLDIAKSDDDVQTGYIVRLDRGSADDYLLDHFSNYSMLVESRLNVVYPSENSLTVKQKEYIEEDISKFEKALYSLDYDDPLLGYERYIDVSSFVDYMVINEFFQNYDAAVFSTYLHKSVGGKLTMGPVWDFNNAMDNYIETSYDGTGFYFQNKAWYFMLLKDERFVERVIRRYQELRQTTLSEDYLQNYVDECVRFLGEAEERNFEVWGDSLLAENGLLIPSERNISSYNDAVLQLKSFLHRRGEWMDDNIELLRQYCHESKVKKYQH